MILLYFVVALYIALVKLLPKNGRIIIKVKANIFNYKDNRNAHHFTC